MNLKNVYQLTFTESSDDYDRYSHDEEFRGFLGYLLRLMIVDKNFCFNNKIRGFKLKLLFRNGVGIDFKFFINKSVNVEDKYNNLNLNYVLIKRVGGKFKKIYCENLYTLLLYLNKNRNLFEVCNYIRFKKTNKKIIKNLNQIKDVIIDE